MLEKVESILTHYDEDNRMLEEVGDDSSRAAELARERSELEVIVTKGLSITILKTQNRCTRNT